MFVKAVKVDTLTLNVLQFNVIPTIVKAAQPQTFVLNVSMVIQTHHVKQLDVRLITVRQDAQFLMSVPAVILVILDRHAKL
jgi:hypothetical protein